MFDCFFYDCFLCEFESVCRFRGEYDECLGWLREIGEDVCLVVAEDDGAFYVEDSEGEYVAALVR